MVRSRDGRGPYDWMLELSAEGWAWEFLRRNAYYRREYETLRDADRVTAARAALHWGLLQFSDPDVDARAAIVFWSPVHNQSVLPLVTAGDGPNALNDVKCKVSVLEPDDSLRRHILYSCSGLFLQLSVRGEGDLSAVRYMIDALPEHSSDRKLLALRRLADLSQHKRLRPEMYSRQRRGPRLARILQILDSFDKDPAYRSVARDVFGEKRVKEEWDNLRDHVRRAVVAGRKLTQNGYLKLLG